MSHSSVRIVAHGYVDTNGPIAVAAGEVLTGPTAAELMMTAIGHTTPSEQVVALMSLIVTFCAAHDDPGAVLIFLFETCAAGLAQFVDLPAGHA